MTPSTQDVSPIALITGATSGIGEACARRFVREGYRVILAGRREDRLSALASDFGSNAHVLPLDVRDREAIGAAIASLPASFQAIDVLVNNAGLALGLSPAHQANADEWDQMIDTNCRGLVHMTRAVLPGMVARNRGHILNIGSVAGSYPYPGGNVYGATKAFVERFSLNLRADLLGKAVRVTNIEPGMVETEFSLVRYGGDSERASKVYKGMTPMAPADIADVIVYCVRLPPHVNVNRIELMATQQAFSPFAVHREST